MLTFSIIIPAKNEEENIGRCLQSINEIDYPKEDFEVIVVDNGSNDSTAAIAKSIGARVFIKPGLTISALRNYGASKSEGRVLVFLDADCTVSRDWLQKAEKYAGREDVACFGSPPVIPSNATWVQQTWYLVRKKKEEVEEVSWLESMNMFIHKGIFERVNGFDESLITCEDVDISYRLVKYGKIISDSSIVVIHWGEAKTVGEFFRKERWRAKGNYNGVRRHGIRLDELPSLILPTYFLLLSIIFLYFFVRGKEFIWTTFFFWQSPILLISMIKVGADFNVINYFRLFVLYNVYLFARALAIFL